MKTSRLVRLITGCAVAGVALAGCSGGSTPAPAGSSPASSSAAADAEHDDADVTFAQNMIVHHRQAVEMAGMATDRSQNAQVRDLADRIEAAQQPEIDTMTGWLQEWGAEAPAGGDTSMGTMDHGGTSHGGMDMGGSGVMTPEQMQQLGQANGPAFDRMFLEMMIEHHRGAIEMAMTEVAEGADPRATQLAQNIIDAQQAEITEMESLLQQV